MAFSAHDVNQAYNEGVRHERKRILNMLQQWIESDHLDIIDIWDEIRQGEGKKLTALDFSGIDLG